MERFKSCYGALSTEPVMFLYMFSSYMKMPVFMTLLFEKACYDKYGWNATDFCTNISAIRNDTILQDEANRLFILSSLALLIPSIFTALFLGSLSDIWSIKYAMLISFGGLIISNVNYILQSYFVKWHAYWLLPSDLIFGMCGGFSAVIGILFAYSTKFSPAGKRNVKIAVMEGAIGIGGTIGSVCSGYARRQFGFVAVFAIVHMVLLLAFLYIIIFIRDIKPSLQTDTSEPLMQAVGSRIREIGEMYSNPTRDRFAQYFLNIVLIALFVEFVCFAGLADILFPYVRYCFGWTDVEYGIFSGFSMGLPSLAVIFLYPFLHKKCHISDGLLAIIGIFTKIASLVTIAVVTAGWLAMCSLVLSVFSRFISAGLRSMACFYVSDLEQGKLFSLIGLLQSLAYLIASPIFNGGYRATFKYWPGTMLIVLAALLLIPILFLIYIERSAEEKRLQRLSQEKIADEQIPNYDRGDNVASLAFD